MTQGAAQITEVVNSVAFPLMFETIASQPIGLPAATCGSLREMTSPRPPPAPTCAPPPVATEPSGQVAM